MRLLLDADAFLFMRKASLLAVLSNVTESGAITLHMTEYVARHELSSVGGDIDELARGGRLSMHAVRVGSAAYDVYRDLKRTADKGEAESVAWAVAEAGDTDDLLYVSLDRRARELAERKKIEAGDVLDVAVIAVLKGFIGFDGAARKLSDWDEHRGAVGRPRDYTTFAETFERRARRWQQFRN